MGILQDYAQFLSNGGLIPYAASGLEYLRNLLFPPAPSTEPVGESYSPPFLGGQCIANYYVSVVSRVSIPNYSPDTVATNNSPILSGRITSIDYGYTSNEFGIRFGYADIGYDSGAAIYRLPLNFGYQPSWNFSIDSVALLRADGLADNCGDLPNPAIPPSIPDDGLADSSPPNFSDPSKNEPIVDGSPYSDSGDAFASDAQDDFADAGALAPNDAAGALGKIAEGLLNLAKLLSLLNEILSLLKDLLGKENKSSFRYDFGSIEKDGFLRLFPEAQPEEIECLYIDIAFKQIKNGIGKQFGDKSPNLYLYEPLGSVQFVSSSFGILSNHPLIAARNSIAVPPLAYGFFYRMGLDGENKANVSAFYLKIEKE